MSDETVYGKVSYRLPFSTAVAAGIIVPYKVIISVSLNKEVDAELLRRGSTRVRRDEIQAKWVANQIALKRAIEKTGASKVITFHSRVNLAEDFAGDDARGFKEHVKGFDVFHVNGSQNAADRKALLEGFKAAPKGLITNARCLTEGVDVPAVDMVAFVDPRKSKIDIAQAAGRAMRQSKATNKKLGYIVVPLFIEQKKGETEAEAFTRSGFDEVAEVLGAMLESDDDLVDTIKEMQEARGRGDKFNPRQLHEKIEVIGPAINLDKLTQSIDVEILERLGLSWDRWFGLLQRFHNQSGHCKISVDYEINGLKLGSWARQQRKAKSKLSHDRIKRLDSLGFSWDPLSDQWEEAFAALQRFHAREGHFRVSRDPTTLKVFGLNLGAWASGQRQKKGQLTVEQVRRLDDIGFNWDARADKWEEAFSALREYHHKNGHCRVPKEIKIKGINLGGWVSTQRIRKSRLNQERIRRLDSLGFSWDPITEDWEEAFAALQQYQKKAGHCKAPKKLTINGIKLEPWITMQRAKVSALSRDQIERLNSLGFSWDPHAEQWEANFSELKKFCMKEGHARVPYRHAVNGLKLGSWVIVQRARKNQLTVDQIRRLNVLNFSWDPGAEEWELRFTTLKEFREREGHCDVPRGVVLNGVKLGQWVHHQRNFFREKKWLSAERIKKLDAIGFSWDPFADQWEKAFVELQRFHAQEGHCRVPRNLSVNGLSLGSWVKSQRLRTKLLTPERIKRLKSLGFTWSA
jgi:hypothetical protein